MTRKRRRFFDKVHKRRKLNTESSSSDSLSSSESDSSSSESDSMSSESVSSVSSVHSESFTSAPSNLMEDECSQDTFSVLDEELDYTNFVPIRASSPVVFDSDDSFEIRDSSSLSSDAEEDFLYSGSDVTLHYLSQRVAMLSRKHSLPDAAVGDILKLIGDVLPIPNKCPTLYKHKRNLAIPLSMIEVNECSDGKVYLLPFAQQVETVMKKHANANSLVGSGSSTVFTDITSGRLFPHIDGNTLYFILNTDGFSPILSRKIQVWPLLLSIVNLPPAERIKMSNVIMVGFYMGRSKPQWDGFLKHLIDRLRVRVGERKMECKVVALVADAPAKSSCCYIQNTNARFGCATCLVEGTYNQEVHKMTFPVSRNFNLRTEVEHRNHMQQGTSDCPTFGVKGTSPLHEVLRLPIQVPYDVMHLVYLGMAKRLLQIVVDKRLIDKVILSTVIDSTKVPHSFRRRPSNLINELSLWKSQQHKVFLLYLSPLCVHVSQLTTEPGIASQIKLVFVCLSSSILTLSSEAVRGDFLQSVERVIYNFQKLMEITFGASVLTGTLHAIIHLPRQVRNFGRLSATSATCFENVNRFLKRSVTGKTSQGPQIAERFLCMQKYSSHEPTEPCLKLSGSSATSRLQNVLDIFGLPDNTVLVDKVTVGHLTFHSYDYGKGLSCASYFAFLDDNVFVKIKCFFKVQDELKCICRTYRTQCAWHEYILSDVPASLKSDLDKISCHFKLQKSGIKIYDIQKLSNHAIVSKVNVGIIYGVKVVNDFDHE